MANNSLYELAGYINPWEEPWLPDMQNFEHFICVPSYIGEQAVTGTIDTQEEGEN